MSSGIPGDPGAIRAAARQLRAASGEGDRALTQIDTGRDTALSGWRGAAADAFDAHVGRVRPVVARLVELGADAAPHLEGYADALEAAQARYAAAHATAITESGKAAGAEDGSQEQYQARKAQYDAERGMQAAQSAAWEANYRPAQAIAALTGHALPAMQNPHAYQPPPPPEKPEDDGWSWSDIGHGLLDVAGVIPVIGEPADVINGVWYAAEGNYVDAGLSFGSAVPGWGYTATAAKYGRRGLNAADGVNDAARASDKATELLPLSQLPKTYQRPSGYRKGVREQVWDNAKRPDGTVVDPLTGRIIREGDKWDMGHRPQFEFRKHANDAYQRGIDRKTFLDEHNDPSHYRPELPSSNRSHKDEDTTDIFLGP